MKRISFMLVVVMLLTSIMMFGSGDCEANAKTTSFAASALKDSELTIDHTQRTLYTVPKELFTDRTVLHDVSAPFYVSGHIKDDKYDSYYFKYGSQLWKKYESIEKKIRNSLKYTSSNPDVVAFVSYEFIEDELGGYSKPIYHKSYQAEKDLYPRMMALKTGTSTITIYSTLLKQSVTCKITVKNAEIVSGEYKYYTGNTYQLTLKSYEDRLKAVSYSSSNPAVAKVFRDGRVKTNKAGTATLSCTAENGRTYKKKIKVEKAGLNYTKLTSYYFTGLAQGFYSYQPLVAKGITVKKWTSSDPNIATVSKKGAHVGQVKIKQCGKVKITAIATNGKKYTCQLTLVGGKKWSGLSGGYIPTLATIRQHGYYNDINKIQDYGDVIYYIIDYGHQINYQNGNNEKYTWSEADKYVYHLLRERYPDKEIGIAGGGDFLGVDGGPNKYGRLATGCYYVKGK